MKFAIQKLGIIKEWIKRHPLIVIFFIAFFVYTTATLYIAYYNSIIVNIAHDIIYGFDTGFRFQSLYEYKKIGDPAAHPLTSILQPIIGMTWALVRNNKMTMVLSQTLVASCTSCLFYSCLQKVITNNFLKILLTTLFTCSFSNIISTVLPEHYIYNGLAQVLFLLYSITISRIKTKLTLSQLAIIAMLSIFSFGINLSNILLVFANITFILISKYHTNLKKIFFDSVKILLLAVILITPLTLCQKNAFGSKTFLHSFETKTKHKYSIFFNNYKASDRLSYTLKGTLIQPFYSMKNEISKKEFTTKKWRNIPETKSKRLYFAKKQNIGRYLPALLFIFVPLIFTIRRFKTLEHKGLVTFLSSIILINAICNYYYEVQNCFIYAQNNLCYLILLIAILYSYVPKKIAIPACLAFLAYQIPTNLHALHFIQKFVSKTATQHHSVGTWMLWSLIISIAVGLIGYVTFKLVKKEIWELPTEKKYLLFTSLYLGLTLIFLVLVALGRG